MVRPLRRRGIIHTAIGSHKIPQFRGAGKGASPKNTPILPKNPQKSAIFCDFFVKIGRFSPFFQHFANFYRFLQHMIFSIKHTNILPSINYFNNIKPHKKFIKNLKFSKKNYKKFFSRFLYQRTQQIHIKHAEIRHKSHKLNPPPKNTKIALRPDFREKITILHNKKAAQTKPKIIQKHQSIFIAMNNQNHINIRPKP